MATETNVANEEMHEAERTREGLVYRPQVDIVESSDELLIVADVPGVRSGDIDINFEDGVLTLAGKTHPRYPEDRRWLGREFGIGDYYRTFRVHEQVDVAKIHAEYADGVLTVHLPKAASAKPRKIEVQGAR